MPALRKVSGEKTVKVLCNKFDFSISGRAGSHVRLSKQTPEGKIGTVVVTSRTENWHIKKHSKISES